jgi:hypothetical protein
MKKIFAGILATVSFTLCFRAKVVAQSDCTILNAVKSEGKFTGQISSQPDGSSMQVSYADQTVLVHYTNSVTICEGGRSTSLSALTRGASVSVFGPTRRNGKNIEIDANRIFVAGRPQTTAPTPSGGSQPDPRSLIPDDQSAQPLLTIARPIPNSVILRGGTHEETMQRLHVIRKYDLTSLRTSPQITAGEARLDFTPMLNNPKALFNVAQQLHELPQHVQVIEEGSEVSEVDEGVVIHHVLSYRILPGKCADSAATAQLARAGIGCFTRAPMNERLAEFSKHDSPRYVANAQKRQEAITDFQRNAAKTEADANSGIAHLRTALSDPTQRAAIVARVGEAETTRMASLNDDQLKEEVINSGVQRIEQVMFIPKSASANYEHLQHTLTITPSTAEMNAAETLLRDGVPEHPAGLSNFPKLLKIVPARPLAPSAAPSGDKAGEVDLGPYTLLTGFTLSHDYEWSWGEWITINWCIVGCSSTYGLGLHAGFNYAFGLRFPIHAGFNYHEIVHPNNSANAELTATFDPILGTPDNFFEAGLSADQVFDGKEFVAQFGADAGYDISLPGFGTSDDFPIAMDFTQILPSPFKGGAFQPPAPGSHIDGQWLFDQIDLLGGLLNFGVAGGQLSPALQLSLHSNRLQLTFNDENLHRQTRLTSSPQKLSIGVTAIPAGNQSHFSIGNPVYNLSFTLTPGLDPNIWINIDVWSGQWNFPIFFPQLAVDLPANGIDFGCHAGTTCVLDFTEVYNASTGQFSDMSRAADAADRTLTGGGCNGVGARSSGELGKYRCPVKDMYSLCQAMLKNGAVAGCTAVVENVVNEILTRGHCTSNDGDYVCPHEMMGLCNAYLKNEQVLSCEQSN